MTNSSCLKNTSKLTNNNQFPRLSYNSSYLHYGEQVIASFVF